MNAFSFRCFLADTAFNEKAFLFAKSAKVQGRHSWRPFLASILGVHFGVHSRRPFLASVMAPFAHQPTGRKNAAPTNNRTDAILGVHFRR